MTQQPKQGWITAVLNAFIPGLGFLYLDKPGMFLLALFLTSILIPTVIGSLALWLFWILISFSVTNTWNQEHAG